MLKHTKQKLQFIDCLPLVIDAQATILERWCKKNGWINFEVTNNLQFRAIPPGGLHSEIVPVEAFSNIKSQEISDLLDKLNVCKQLNASLAAKALAYNLLCLCMLMLNEPVKNAIAQADFAVSIYWLMNIATFCAVIIAIASTGESLLKRWEYRKLKNNLVELLNQQEEPKVTPESSWLERHAGIFANDPFYNEFVEEMAAYRRELDAEVNAWLDAEDNKQPDTNDSSN